RLSAGTSGVLRNYSTHRSISLSRTLLLRAWDDPSMPKISAILIQLVGEIFRWWALSFRSSRSIEAENLFLRRQLGLYIERGVKPRRIDPVTRISLTVLSPLFSWRDALVVVRPERLIRWHRARSRLLCPVVRRN